MEGLLSAVGWLEADQNPTGLRVLDCRGFTLRWTSLTDDPRIAQSFGIASTGVEYRGRAPRQASRIECELHYPSDGQQADGPLFLADSMEDKWDVYLYNGLLYFARSWRKELVFRSGLEFNDRRSILRFVDAAPESKFDDPTLPVRQVDFLIKSHLYRVPVPHPLPHGFPDDPEKIATYSMNLFGRWAAFATYGDTTRLPVDWRLLGAKGES